MPDKWCAHLWLTYFIHWSFIFCFREQKEIIKEKDKQLCSLLQKLRQREDYQEDSSASETVERFNSDMKASKNKNESGQTSINEGSDPCCSRFPVSRERQSEPVHSSVKEISLQSCSKSLPVPPRRDLKSRSKLSLCQNKVSKMSESLVQ